MALTPQIFQLQEDTLYDHFCEKNDIIEIQPTNGQNNLGLGSPIRFNFTCDRFCLLSSPRSGIRIRVGFLTRENNVNNMNANITLGNNWAAYLFDSAKLSIGNSTIETVSQLGTAVDIFHNLKGDEFRKNYGEMCGFIPDENSGLADQIEFSSNITQAQLGGNAAFHPTIVKNNSFNNGFKRRMELYNYTVANNDTVRYAEAFLSLSSIFGFCESVEKLLKFVNIDIEMIRSQNNDLISFGAANTSISFGDPATTGIINLKLEIETIRPNSELISSLNSQLKSPIKCSFLHRSCDNKPQTNNIVAEFNETKFNSPRYIFIVSHTPTRNLFRHLNMDRIKISIGDELYPNLDFNGRFLENSFTKYYQEYVNAVKYLDSSPAITMKDFRDLYSVFCVDCSNQVEKIKSQNRSLGISIQRRAIPVNDDIVQNPIQANYYILTLNQKTYVIDCIANTVKEEY